MIVLLDLQVWDYLCVMSLRAQLSSSAQSFEDNRVPLLYVYSDSDELIDASLNAEFAEMFGAHHSDLTDVYDAECQPKHLCQKTGDSLNGRFNVIHTVS